MVGLGVLNGILGPTHLICLCKQCLHWPGILRDSPLSGPINAGSCLNHAWRSQALNTLFYFKPGVSHACRWRTPTLPANSTM